MAHLVELGGRLGRRLVFGMDDHLRRLEGIYAFSQDPDCVLRISLGTCQKERLLRDGRIVHAGDPVIELHWWNERIAGMAAAGSSLHWGLQFYRHSYHSLIELAQYLDRTPALRDVVALHGETTFSSDLSQRHHASVFQRLGFELQILPAAGDPWEFVSLFFRHLHVWALTWACNPTSLRGKRPWEAVRSEVWISRHALLERCIGAAAPPMAIHGANGHQAGTWNAEHARTGAAINRAQPRLASANTTPLSGNTDGWTLLRAYMRSYYSRGITTHSGDADRGGPGRRNGSRRGPTGRRHEKSTEGPGGPRSRCKQDQGPAAGSSRAGSYRGRNRGGTG
jgi:YkoP-like protein